jgi:hypothetical protein
MSHYQKDAMTEKGYVHIRPVYTGLFTYSGTRSMMEPRRSPSKREVPLLTLPETKGLQIASAVS